MPTTRGRLTLLVAIGAYVVGWAFGTRETFVFAVGLALAVVVAVIYVRMAAGPFRLDRHLASGHYIAGDDLAFDISVRSVGGRLPAGAGLRGVLPGQGEATVPLEHLGDRLSARVHLPALPRGRYVLGSAELQFDDALGLASRRHALPGGGNIVVYPRIVSLERMPGDGGGPGGVAGQLMIQRGGGYDLHSVREYMQGDSLRRVHWPTTARRSRLMVKELEDQPRDDAAVILDANAAFVRGKGLGSSFEVAVSAAASLMQRLATDGRRASLILSGARVERIQTLGEADWHAALDALATVSADGRRPVASLLGDAGAGVDAIRLFLVTSDLSPSLADRLAGMLLRRRIVIVFIDSATFAGGDAAAADARATAAVSALRRQGVPVVRISRGEDLGAALRGEAAVRATA